MLLLSFLQSPLQSRLRLPHLGFGCVCPCSFLLEGGYHLTGLRVVPAELTVLRPDQQDERGAVAMQDSSYISSTAIGPYWQCVKWSPASPVPLGCNDSSNLSYLACCVHV